MYEEGGLGIVNRVGETNSVGYDGISAWNAHAGTFREFLYEHNLVPKIRWFSDVKRVSKYLRGNIIPESIYDTVIRLTDK